MNKMPPTSAFTVPDVDRAVAKAGPVPRYVHDATFENPYQLNTEVKTPPLSRGAILGGAVITFVIFGGLFYQFAANYGQVNLRELTRPLSYLLMPHKL